MVDFALTGVSSISKSSRGHKMNERRTITHGCSMTDVISSLKNVMVYSNNGETDVKFAGMVMYDGRGNNAVEVLGRKG